MRRRSVILIFWFLAPVAALLLILFARQLPGLPGLAAGSFAALAFLGIGSDRAPGLLARRWPWFLAVLGALHLLSFDQGFYFSDDAKRHLIEGYYLLQRIDVFTIPPILLPSVDGLRANHDHFGSVYFPGTHLLAMLGAWLSPRYGYFALYDLLAFGLLAASLRRASWRERRDLLGLVAMPAMLIFGAARHGDYLGFLLLGFAILMLRGSRWGAGLVGGLALAGAASLKPEGWLWSGALLAMLWFPAANRSPGRSILNLSVATLSYVLALALVACAAWRWIFAWPESWTSFLYTLQIFANYFVAYNPVVAWREAFWMAQRPESLIEWRHQVCAALLFGGLSLPLLLSAQLQRVVLDENSGLRWREFLGALQRLVPAGLVMSLAGGILLRGAWNPWYFAWLLPALQLCRARRALRIIGGSLSAFYLPLADYRAGLGWDMRSFYVVIVAAVLLGNLLTSSTARAWFQRIWRRRIASDSRR
ncbi:MAG: hypothetical protein K1X75_05645 [Leptospirales bacterium]|nr:hypothetical protein [Leptospirales bacterium]